MTEAAGALEQAVALRPSDGTALADLGSVYLRQGRVDDAQAALQRALALDPTLPLANNTMGLTALRRGTMGVAEAHFREAIRLQPDLAEAHNNLGNLLAGRRAYAEAAHHFEKAVASNPRDVEARHSYGVTLALAGSYARAATELEAVVALGATSGHAADRPRRRAGDDGADGRGSGATDGGGEDRRCGGARGGARGLARVGAPASSQSLTSASIKSIIHRSSRRLSTRKSRVASGGCMSTRHSRRTRAAFLFVWLVLLAVPAAAQSFYGSLVSVVKDDQDNVIPGATITLVNTGTGERREGVSADDGVYRFVNLVPGTYRLEVELTGFQRYVRDQIEVNVQSAPRIDVSLKVGSLAETIQVAGTAPVLQTENASVGLVVGQPARAGAAAQRPQRAEPDHARPVGRSARQQRGKSDRQERVRGRKLPGRRRNGEPERLVLRRRAGAGFGLRQHRRADTQP